MLSGSRCGWQEREEGADGIRILISPHRNVALFHPTVGLQGIKTRIFTPAKIPGESGKVHCTIAGERRSNQDPHSHLMDSWSRSGSGFSASFGMHWTKPNPPFTSHPNPIKAQVEKIREFPQSKQSSKTLKLMKNYFYSLPVRTWYFRVSLQSAKRRSKFCGFSGIEKSMISISCAGCLNSTTFSFRSLVLSINSRMMARRRW